MKPDFTGRFYKNPFLAIPISLAVGIAESGLSEKLALKLDYFW